MICEGSAPFNDNVFYKLTSYLEVLNPCHSASYSLPNFDDSIFALDATSAINSVLTDSTSYSFKEDFPGGGILGLDKLIISSDNAKLSSLKKI
jgi:hypothetical protein